MLLQMPIPHGVVFLASVHRGTRSRPWGSVAYIGQQTRAEAVTESKSRNLPGEPFYFPKMALPDLDEGRAYLR
jgi:hypothetical protein